MTGVFYMRLPLTPGKKILSPILPALGPATLRSRVRRSTRNLSRLPVPHFQHWPSLTNTTAQPSAISQHSVQTRAESQRKLSKSSAQYACDEIDFPHLLPVTEKNEKKKKCVQSTYVNGFERKRPDVAIRCYPPERTLCPCYDNGFRLVFTVYLGLR